MTIDDRHAVGVSDVRPQVARLSSIRSIMQPDEDSISRKWTLAQPIVGSWRDEVPTSIHSYLKSQRHDLLTCSRYYWGSSGTLVVFRFGMFPHYAWRLHRVMKARIWWPFKYGNFCPKIGQSNVVCLKRCLLNWVLNIICVSLLSDMNEVRRACERISDEDRLDEEEDLKINRLRVRDKSERRGIVLFAEDRSSGGLWSYWLIVDCNTKKKLCDCQGLSTSIGFIDWDCAGYGVKTRHEEILSRYWKLT